MSKKWLPKVQMMNPKSLVCYSKNSKIHTKDQVKKLAGMIAEFGFTQPIVVDKDLIIITGHCRRAASIELNLSEVPVIIADHLTEDQIIAARIADNKIAESPWDENFLKFELQTLKLHDFKLDLIGFEMPQIEEFLLDGELKPEYFNNIKYENTDNIKNPEIKNKSLDKQEFNPDDDKLEDESKNDSLKICPHCGEEI